MRMRSGGGRDKALFNGVRGQPSHIVRIESVHDIGSVFFLRRGKFPSSGIYFSGSFGVLMIDEQGPFFETGIYGRHRVFPMFFFPSPESQTPTFREISLDRVFTSVGKTTSSSHVLHLSAPFLRLAKQGGLQKSKQPPPSPFLSR